MRKVILLLGIIPYIALGAWYNFKEGFNIAKAQTNPLWFIFIKITARTVSTWRCLPYQIKMCQSL